MLTIEKLKQVLTYHPETGHFICNMSRGKLKKGEIAGYQDEEGYISLFVDGKKYKAHRVAWLYMTGRWPTKDIDHIDRVRNNNRFANLRECTNSQNHMNRRFRDNNTSGYRGVTYSKKYKNWVASICVNYIRVGLGSYQDLELAALVAEEARAKWHKEFAADDSDVHREKTIAA